MGNHHSPFKGALKGFHLTQEGDRWALDFSGFNSQAYRTSFLSPPLTLSQKQRKLHSSKWGLSEITTFGDAVQLFGWNRKIKWCNIVSRFCCKQCPSTHNSTKPQWHTLALYVRRHVNKRRKRYFHVRSNFLSHHKWVLSESKADRNQDKEVHLHALQIFSRREREQRTCEIVRDSKELHTETISSWKDTQKTECK